MQSQIGIIGGTGLYSLLEKSEETTIKTKYGLPSSNVSIGKIGDKKVAFIARHGENHTIAPHMVPYRANIEAFAELGVQKILTTNAVGSLNPSYKPGDIVFIDQFVNMTQGRHDTFFDQDKVVHKGMADPYCKSLRQLGISQAQKLNLNFHDKGTVVVVNGPRFSTRAESRFFSRQGFDIINMTQYPEAALAREKGICYLGVGIITDYDAGIEGTDIKAVTFDQVQKVFSENIGKTKELLNLLIPQINLDVACECSKE